NQEDLDAFGQRLADEITGLVNRRLLSMEPDTLETMLETGSTGALTDEIGRTYTDIENLSLHLGTVKFPDFALYISMRDLYREYLKFQQEILSAAAAGNAERHINSRLRLDELAQYGELLTKYPLLLDYLRLGLD
ncbi:MAG: hypothetical protein LBT11_03170, partial [Treponema sp.]|nr:hypothetical protein [Treponema sp.]